MSKSKLIAVAMATVMTASVLLSGCGGSAKNNEKPDNSPKNYSLATNIQDGAILHCFCWSFNTIKESMEDIAAAGYSSIQTSPANECIVGGNGGMELMGQGKWYYHYQPTDWKIGNYQLGTEEDFKAMCAEADKYGIKVIVDVVPNHTTPNESAVGQGLIDAVGGIDKLYHTTGKTGIESYADRKQCTLYQQGGLNDVNTENKDFQDYFIAYLNKCIEDGADGFRYDTAKHIGLSDDPKDEGVTENNFWKRVTTEITNASSIFNYGEVLQGDNDRAVDYVKEIGSVTASSYGQTVRMAVAIRMFNLSNLTSLGVGSETNLVTWVESHDNYTSGESVTLNEEDVKLAWAFITARKSGTPLFFARPYGNTSDNMWGTMNRIGVAGSYSYKDPTVVAVNKFRNAMVGQEEKLYNVGNDTTTMAIERGNKGLVIINADDKDKTLDTTVGLADGSYADRVTNSTTYTVSGGKITGTLKARSAIVLYNDGYVEIGSIPSVKIADGTNCVYNTDSVNVTLNCVNTSNATYSLNGAAEQTFTDGQSITVATANEADANATLTLRGTSADGNKTVMTYVFTHKKGIVSGTKIYFEKPDTWGNEINAYVYDESTSNTRTNGEWPGVSMTDEGNGVYSYTFTDSWDAGLVIFSDGNNQCPASMEPGFEVEADKTYTVQ